MYRKYIGILVIVVLICLIGIGVSEGCTAKNKLKDGDIPGIDTRNHSGKDASGEGMPGEDDDYIVVGFSQIGSESDWRNASTESFKNLFTPENGYYLLYEDAQQKQENQLKAVRNFILQEVDYIILDPIVETGWDTVLMEAKDAGIPVILVDRQIVVEDKALPETAAVGADKEKDAVPEDDNLYTCWVGSDFAEEGRQAGKWLEDYLAERGRQDEEIQIVTLQGTPDSSAQIGRTNGFREIFDAHDNWNMLDYGNGEFTQAKGQEVMEGFLSDYKDIDVVISENDNMTFGAVEAIGAAGRSCGPEGDIIIISFDAVRAALEFMKDGRINADFECNPLLGPMVSEIIGKLEAGESVEKIQHVEEQYFDASMDLDKILKERVY